MKKRLIAAFYVLLGLFVVCIAGGVSLFIIGLHQMSPDNFSPPLMWVGIGMVCFIPLLGQLIGIVGQVLNNEDQGGH